MKIVNSATVAGATPEQAESLATEVESWVKTSVTDGVIQSAAIRAKVLEGLRAANPAAANAYETFIKPTA